LHNSFLIPIFELLINQKIFAMKSLIQALIQYGGAQTEQEAMWIICEMRNAVREGTKPEDILKDYNLSPSFASLIRD
jgi:hypothetical protein